MNVVRAASQEESIPTFLRALLRQPLKIPKFPDGHPPHRQHERVQAVILGRERLGRPDLQHGIVAHSGCKVVVVEEVDHLRRLLEPRIRVLRERLLVRKRLLPRRIQAEVLVNPSEPHNENISDLKGDILGFRTGLEVGDTDAVARMGIVILLGPRVDVKENPTASSMLVSPRRSRR